MPRLGARTVSYRIASAARYLCSSFRDGWKGVVVSRSRVRCIVFGYSPVHSLLFRVPAAGYPLASLDIRFEQIKANPKRRAEPTELTPSCFCSPRTSPFPVAPILYSHGGVFTFADIGSAFGILKAVLSCSQALRSTDFIGYDVAN